MRVDLHVHTASSPDSLTSLQHVLYWAQRRQLGALAITDHNTISGALALQEIAPIPIIVGEEIRTRQGEVMGLFLRQPIAAGLTVQQTVSLIHQQGGLVYIPHPLDRSRRSSALNFGALMQIVEQIDIIETLNARVMFRADNQLASQLCSCYRLRRGAGSDAHQGYEIGQAYVEMPAFSDAASFLEALDRGQIQGQTSSPLVRVGSVCARLAKNLVPTRAPNSA